MSLSEWEELVRLRKQAVEAKYSLQMGNYSSLEEGDKIKKDRDELVKEALNRRALHIRNLSLISPGY